MGRIFGSVGLLIVVLIGLYVYTKQMTTAVPGGQAPTTMVDVLAVNNDLLAMANAEKRYWATNAKYGSLSELQSNGDIQVPKRRSFNYSAEVGESGFKIIATHRIRSESPSPRQRRRDDDAEDILAGAV